MAIEDSGVAGNELNTDTGDIPESVLNHIEEVFSQADNDGEMQTAEQVAESTPEVTPVAERPNTTRRSTAAHKQEEAEELEEQGLEDEEATAIDKDKEEVETPAEEPAVEAAALDPNLRFAAEQFGWTPDKIDKLYAADPELATSTFQNLLSAFTNLSRQNLATGQRPPQANVTAQQQAPISRLDTLYANLKTFAEENGDTMVEQLLKPLHEEVIIPFRQIQAELAIAKQQAVRSEVNTVVADLGKQFPEVYGGEKATIVQQQSRQQLYQMADQFRAGASLQGKEMSVSDALKRAHLVLTADQRIAEGRKQVQQQVQKRSKAITARPTQRRSPTAMNVSKGNDAAAEAYERRAHELGIEV